MHIPFIKRINVFLVFCLLVCSPIISKEILSEQSLQGLNKYINEAMKDWNAPSLAICIVNDGKIILSKGFGFRDIKNNLKATSKTLFAIASCTKSFTATAMGILVDQGKIKWDEPVRKYLPSFKLNDSVVSERITPRDMLTQRSGLPGHDLMWYNTSATRKELFNRLQYLKLNRDFRTAFQYCNLMYMGAGYLIGQVAGTTWEEFIQKHIFDPLGMKESNFSIEDSKKASDFALPYKEKDGKIVEIPFRNVDAIGPAGSINSNLEEMAKWVLLNLNKGKFGDKQVISEASLNQVHSPQIIMATEVNDEFSYQSYAMGLAATSYRGYHLIHHGGGIDGFSSYISFMPRENLGIVVLANSNCGSLPMAVTYRAYDQLLGLDQIPWSKRLLEEYSKAIEQFKKQQKINDKDRKLNTKPTHSLEQYAGDFENPGYGIISIKKEKDQLDAVYNSITYPLKHYYYDIFELTDALGRENKVFFLMDEKGNIRSLSSQFEPTVEAIVFTRMAEKEMMQKSFLEKFVGNYELQGDTCYVTLKGENILTISFMGQEVELLPYKGTEFKFKNIPVVSIEFRMDASGTVTDAVIKQPSGTIITKKKKD